MKVAFTFCACFFLFAACKKSASSTCTPESFEYSYQKDKAIDTVLITPPNPTAAFLSFQIGTGTKLVFRYRHHFQDCPELADDEGFSEIVFEVPSGSTSFQIQDSTALRGASTLLRHACFCAYNARYFTKGAISGTKTGSATWSITGSLTSPDVSGKTISISGSYSEN